jgi:hypothetical protein
VRIRFIQNLTSLILTLVVLGACAAPEGDAARLAADSCAADPFTPVSATNQFAAGPVEVFFADPTRGDWFSRAKQRAQLSARAAAQDAYWQPLADSWGIAEARARASTAPEAAASARDLKLSYAMVTKDAYCRIALVRIGTQLSASQ